MEKEGKDNVSEKEHRIFNVEDRDNKDRDEVVVNFNLNQNCIQIVIFNENKGQNSNR